MKPLISIYDTPGIDRLRAELKFDPRRLRGLQPITVATGQLTMSAVLLNDTNSTSSPSSLK